MAAKTPEDRLDRLEQVMAVFAERQIALEEDHLDLRKVVAELATETRRGFDQIAENMTRMSQEMDRRFRETDERMRQTDERISRMSAESERRSRESERRSRQLDERVDRLVSAVGDFLRQQPGP